MAEELVVNDILTDAMIEAGAELIRQIDKSDWPVAAALWYYFSDANQWKLIIASPRVAEAGPREAYKRIQEALNTMPDEVPHIRLRDILVTEVNHPLIRLFSAAVGTGAGIGKTRVRENVIDGTFVEDALIYRLDSAPRAA